MKTATVAVGAVTTLWLAAGAVAQTTRQSVAGHQFEVPKDQLFEARIPWLPGPESDSFTFLLEPKPTSDQIPLHRVLVGPLEGRCGNIPSELMRVACGKERQLVDENPQYERRANELGSWASDLFIVKRDAQRQPDLRQQVAYCQLFEPNPVQPQPRNLCTTVWGYKGMLLQFSFDEKEVDRLQGMKGQAMAMLDRWEVR